MGKKTDSSILFCQCSGMKVTVGEDNSGSGLVRVLPDGAAEQTVCYDGFGPRTADVACREAGFAGALSISSVQRSDSALAGVSYSCDGSEISLAACPTASFNVSNCTEMREAVVVCQIKGGRLMSCYGHLSLFHTKLFTDLQ